MAEKILIVEDDEELQEFLKTSLSQENYETIFSTTGKEALEYLKKEMPNLILLDLGLPDMDGLEICRTVKQSASTRTVPVIMLTARSTTDDKVTGLESGADDYIVKPFEPQELMARIKAIFRRLEYYAPVQDEIITKGGITLNVGTRTVIVDYKVNIDLSTKEIQLLYLLMKNCNQVVERGHLLKTLWGYQDGAESRTVDVHIQRLRRKLNEQVNKFNEYLGNKIVTVEGYGYKFVD
ncbi:MAG: response regulator transcription factor [Elusimicrobiota bacterium]